MPGKVVIVGLDGATFDLLGPWIEEGRLPSLKAMVAGGISGELESCVPPVTAPAWTSFMTGKNPGKHGIFDFVTQDKNYQFHPVNSRLRHGKTLWEVIGDQGGRVVVLNVPMTHPPDKVNGALISDFLLATGRGGISFPPELLGEIEGRFGPYCSDIVMPYFMMSQAEEDINRFILEYKQALEYKFQVTHYLLDRFDPDFLMLHLYGNDQITHWLWHIFDSAHPRYRKEESERHFEGIFEYYRAFDDEVGKLLERIGEDGSLFIVSDHGMGPVYKALDFNTWLYDEGYLVLKDRLVTKLRRLGWKAGLAPNSIAVQNWFTKGLVKLASRVLKDQSCGAVDRLKWVHSLGHLLLSFNDVDWSQTKAFSPFGFGQIRINVSGQWAHGCVSPGTQYHQVRQEIVKKLRALRDPETGEAVDGSILTKEEVYHGEYFDHAPDILFVPTNGKYRPNQSSGFTSNKVISDFWGMTGIHKMNGLLIAIGRRLNQGRWIEGAQLIDIFPSVLYLMGMAIPNDVDGRILHQIFADEFLHRHSTRFIDESERSDQRSAEPRKQEEDQEVINRLRGLGYLE